MYCIYIWYKDWCEQVWNNEHVVFHYQKRQKFNAETYSLLERSTPIWYTYIMRLTQTQCFYLFEVMTTVYEKYNILHIYHFER